MTVRAGLLLLCLACLSSPQPSQQPPPIFRSGQELVTIDVTVVDKNGEPVKGLSAQDFVVTVDGQDRSVRAIDYLVFGAGAGDGVAGSDRPRAEGAAVARLVSRLVVLLIDDLSIKPGEARSLVAGALRMLAALPPEDLVGVTTTSGLGPVVNPTRDRAPLITALKSKGMVGRYDDSPPDFFIGVDESLEIERGIPRDTLPRVFARECGGGAPDASLASRRPPDSQCANRVAAAARSLARNTIRRAEQQAAAYTQIIEAVKKSPSPAVIIAVSGGIASGAGRGDFDALAPISHAAAASGVQFYALVEAVDGFDMRDDSPESGKARRLEGRFLLSGIQTLASAAGGDAFSVVGQPDRFFKRIVSETSALYRLGVEVPAVAGRRYGTIKVSVTRPGVVVRSHRHAVLPASGGA